MENVPDYININEPGLVMYGIKGINFSVTMERVLQVLDSGLTSPEKRGYPIRSVGNLFPDKVSLSLIGKQGFSRSSQWFFGASLNPSFWSPGFSFIINSDYVKSNSNLFTAVGMSLRPDQPERHYYTDEEGDLFHKIKFEERDHNAFNDEILVDYIPKEALQYLIIEQQYSWITNRTLAPLKNRPLPTYLVTGERVL